MSSSSRPHHTLVARRRHTMTCLASGAAGLAALLVFTACVRMPGVVSRHHVLPQRHHKHQAPPPPPPPPPPPVIFMRPHFFGAKGDGADATFVPLVIRAVLQFNPIAHVYMLHNDPGFAMPDQPRFHGLLMDEYETQDIRRLKATYTHMSTNPAQYEFYSMAAYFYVASLMDAIGLDEVVVVETDVLVFCDLWHTLATHWDLAKVDAVLTKRRVMAASYVTRLYIETFVNVALAFYSEPAVTEALRASVAGTKWGGVSDMTVNAWLAKPGFVRRNGANHTVRLAELSRLIQVDDEDARHQLIEADDEGQSGDDDGTRNPTHSHLSYIDSNLRTANYSFGAFDMESHPGLSGLVKKLYDPVRIGAPPRARLHPREAYVDMWALHFQGGTKALIPAVYDRFVAGRD